jgi:hypothetical protein
MSGSVAHSGNLCGHDQGDGRAYARGDDQEPEIMEAHG